MGNITQLVKKPVDPPPDSQRILDSDLLIRHEKARHFWGRLS